MLGTLKITNTGFDRADWVIIKLVTTGEYNNNDNGNVEVLLSSWTPFTFPINKSVFDRKNECISNVKGEIMQRYNVFRRPPKKEGCVATQVR